MAGTKATVTASLTSARTGSEFRAELRKKGIDLVLRSNDQGRLYGVTFIDHNSRTVLNGSVLGKEFSANALSARFADIAGGDRREDMQPVPVPSPVATVTVEQSQGAPVTTSTATDETSRPTTVRPTSDNKQLATHSTLPDLSPVGDAAGSLFSIFTPDAGGQNNGQSGPKKRKKKKRQYGRQV
jgi:hypothetical protein